MSEPTTMADRDYVRLSDLLVGDRIVHQGRAGTIVCPVERIITHGARNAETVIEYDRPEHWSHYCVVVGADDTTFLMIGDDDE